MRVHPKIAIDPIARAACFVPLLFAIALAIVGDVSSARACDRGRWGGATALAGVDPGDSPRADTRSSWRPILAGCLGVLFGAAIAVWHIRSSNRP